MLTQDTTVKAMASLTGYNDSAVTVADFVQNACAPTRVMLLGDSITLGVYGPTIAGPPPGYITGYRQRLYDLVTNAGNQVDFVGSQSEGYLVTPTFDTDHEGHGGITDTEVANNVYDWLISNPAEIVILHIGTNELDTSPSDVEVILNEIDRFNINTIVILAKIINHKTYSATTSQFNANLEQMTLNRIVQGDNIVIVDQESTLIYPNDMFDELHPNQPGYEKMAETWYNALAPILPPPACGL
jgi:lysophospholipase L1-like esterase